MTHGDTRLHYAIKNLGSGAGAALSGTSFPGSPVDGQVFYRTDHRTLYAFDSSKAAWLSVGVFEIDYGNSASTNGNAFYRMSIVTGSPVMSATVGYVFGFPVYVCGITWRSGAAPTAGGKVTVTAVGVVVTLGTMLVGIATKKEVETVNSATITADTVIGVKNDGTTTGTSGTHNGKIRLRRIET